MNTELIKKLESNPKFWALPYTKQVNLREKFFDTAAKDDDKYQNLPIEAKVRVKESYVFSMPKFESTPMSWWVKRLSDRYKADDPDAVEMVNYSAGTKSFLDQQQTGRLYQNIGIDPFKVGEGFAEVISEGGRKAMGLWNKIVKGQIPEQRKDTRITVDYLMGKEAAKIKEYFRYLSNEDAYKASQFKAADVGYEYAGRITDIALATAGAGGFFKGAAVAAAPTVFAKQATMLAGKTLAPSVLFKQKMASVANGAAKGRFSYNFLTKTAPMIQRSLVSGGLSGVARETMVDMFKAEDKMVPYELDAKRIMQQYTAYAAGDFALDLGMSGLIPAGRFIAKNFTFKHKIKGFTAKEAVDAVQDYISGKSIPDSLYQQLPKDFRIRTEHGRNLIAAGKLPADILQTDLKAKTVLAAARTNRFIDFAQDGIGLYQESEKGILKGKKYKSHFSALKDVSKDLNEAYKAIPNDLEKAEFREAYQWVMNYSEVADDVTKSFKVMGDELIPAGKRVEADFLQKKGKRIPVEKRIFISPTEAKSFKKQLKSYGYTPVYFDIPDEKILTDAITDFGSYDINYSKNPAKGFVALRNVATLKQYDEAVKIAADLVDDMPMNQKVQHVLIQHGFDGATVNKVGTLRVVDTTNLKVFKGDLDPLTGVSAKYKAPIQPKGINNLTNRGTIKQTIEKEVMGKHIAHNNKFLINEISGLAGNMTEDRVKNTAKLYLLRGNMASDNISVRLTDNPAGFSFIRKTANGGLDVAVPKNITTKKEFRTFVKTFTSQMNKIIGDGGDRILLTAKNIDAFYASKPATFIPPGKTSTQAAHWFRDLIQNGENGAIKQLDNGAYSIQLPGQTTPEIFNSMDEMVDNFILRNLNEDQVRFDLSSKGVALKKTKSGYIATDGSELVGQGKDIPDLLDNMNYRPEKIPREFGANLAYVNDNMVGLHVENGVVSGNKRNVLSFLNKFSDDDILLKSRRVFDNGKETIFKKSTVSYTANIPDANTSSTFTTLAEAKKFTRDAFKTVETIDDIAKQKGLIVFTEADGWTVSNNGESFKAHNPTELKAIMREFPDPSGAPNILPPELKQLDDFGTGKFPPLGQGIQNTIQIQTPHKDLHMGAIRILAQNLEPPKDALRKAATKMGIDKDFMPLIRELEVSLRALNSELTTGNKLIMDMFQEGGKTIPLNRLKGITQLLDSAETGWAKIAENEVLGLSDADFAIARKVRTFLGEDPTQGLFAKFGIDYKAYRENYISHINRVTKGTLTDDLDNLTYEMLSQRAFNDNVPKEFKFWAEHERVNDILHEAHDDNALTILLRYNTQGHKKALLNPTWNKLWQYKNKVGSELPSQFSRMLSQYQERTMGFTLTDFDKTMSAAGRAFTSYWAKAGGKEVTPEVLQMGSDLWNHAQTMVYTGQLALKPHVIMKQTLQPYFTLIPSYGFDRVHKAYRKVLAAPEAAITNLMKYGYVDESLPSVHELSLGKPGKVGRLSRKALARFKTADMLPRALGVEVGNDMVETAAQRWNARNWKTDQQFFKATELNLFDADIQQAILKNIKAGKLEVAKEIGANFVQETSFFSYTPRSAPKVFTSSPGKLFGNYGTYTTQFIQYLQRNAKNASWGQKATFVTRLAASSWASYKAFEAMGVRGSDFLPWQQVGFTGGPLFNVAIDGIRSTGQGYKAQQARRAVIRDLEYIVPGVSNMIHIRKGIEALGNDEPYKAYLYFTNTPLSPNKW